jgi:hypothetical protein
VHIFSAYGIAIGPNKIELVRGWSPPKHLIEFISFMGIISYYRRLIKGFSNIASPKGVKFEWTSKCEKSFQQLKDILKVH